jgi:hypothetical protein
MKKLFLLFFVLHFVSYGQKVDGLEICFEVQKSLKGFAADKEADDALDEILAVIGAAKNFYLIPCDEINNALALTYKGERFILYDKDFIDKINKATNDWSGKFILAHEVGHHINGHTRDFLIASILDDQTKEKQREEELEADEFAGFIVAKLGAKYNQIKELMNTISSEKDDKYSTHPNRSKRLGAIKRGFDKVEVLTSSQEQIVVKTPIKEEKKEVVVIEPEKKQVINKVDPGPIEIINEDINSDEVNFMKMTYDEILTYEEQILKKIEDKNGSIWGLGLPYKFNLMVLQSTDKLIFEWIIYIIVLFFFVKYIYWSYKKKSALKKSIAIEIVYHFALILFGVFLYYIPIIYNDSGNDRIGDLDIYTDTDTFCVTKEGVKPTIDKRLSFWGINSNLYEVNGNRIQFPNQSVIIYFNIIPKDCQDKTFQAGKFYDSDFEYTADEISNAAKKAGLSFTDYKKKHNIKEGISWVIEGNVYEEDELKEAAKKYGFSYSAYIKTMRKKNGANMYRNQRKPDKDRLVVKKTISRYERHNISRHHYSYKWLGPNSSNNASNRNWSIAKSSGAGHQIYMIIDFVLFAVIIRFLFLFVMWMSKTLKS